MWHPISEEEAGHCFSISFRVDSKEEGIGLVTALIEESGLVLEGRGHISHEFLRVFDIASSTMLSGEEVISQVLAMFD